ncbi:extracellular solute-binding protein [Puerhibacterium puerhi]|uniref:extracellular solute-binding protein n=1 Tax=Puerhibacterium puerhi TaxID=2692623 RepID=UPI0013567B8C|nr:extracellular solute-binding protein [Puerhibacterium puerhi]
MTLLTGPGPQMSRRTLLRSALVGAGAVALGATAGCATDAAAGGRTQVRIWDLFSGADGERMQKMQAEAMKANPDVAIESVTLAWGSAYYTKLAMASSGGRPPEAAVTHLSRLAGYAPGGLLEPFDMDVLADLGITQESFAPAVWERASYQGELYALPLDTHPFITFYNPQVVADAGLAGPDGLMRSPGSVDELLAAGKAMAEVTGETGLAYGYVLDTAQAWRLFWGLYAQTGAGYELVPGRSAQIDEQKATEVVEVIQAILDGTVAPRSQDYPGAIASFVTGRSGMIISGEWELPAFQEAIPDVGGMPFPTILGTPANYADSHAFVLPRQAHPDRARRDATYRVLAHIVREGSLTWAGAGHIPAYQPVLSEPDYQKLSPQKDYAAAGEIVVLDPPVWFAGAGGDFQARMSDAMTPAMQGRADAASAVRQMLREMNRFLSTPNPA